MAGPEARRFELFLFGPTRFSVDGHVVDNLRDQLLKALSLLVLNGSCMNRDALVGHLWPDAQVDSGRHQLRNLLTKLRATGLTVERRGESVLIPEPIWCDVVEFVLVAARAMSGVDGRTASYRLALYAQRLWTGPPLEGWRYEEWAIPVRARAFRLQRRLWDMLDSVPLDDDWPPESPTDAEGPPLPPLREDGGEDLSAFRTCSPLTMPEA